MRPQLNPFQSAPQSRGLSVEGLASVFATALPYGVRVTLATNADELAVRAFLHSIRSEFKFTLPRQETDLWDIEKNYQDAGGALFLFEQQGQIVGTLGLYQRSNAVTELRKFYFSPALRGSGLGQTLLWHCVDGLRASGCETFLLESSAVFTAANHLYRQIGFVRSHRFEAKAQSGLQVLELDLKK